MSAKTIRMPKAMLAATLAALRSGEYVQGKNRLCNRYADKPSSYCCLGVMQMALAGETEAGYNLPTEMWLKERGITFLSKSGISMPSPYLPKFGYGAATANDVHGRTFVEIADAWEEAAEGY